MGRPLRWPSNRPDGATAIAVDDSGNVAVTGSSLGSNATAMSITQRSRRTTVPDSNSGLPASDGPANGGGDDAVSDRS